MDRHGCEELTQLRLVFANDFFRNCQTLFVNLFEVGCRIHCLYTTSFAMVVHDALRFANGVLGLPLGVLPHCPDTLPVSITVQALCIGTTTHLSDNPCRRPVG